MRLLLLFRAFLLVVCLVAAAILSSRYSRRIQPVMPITRADDTRSLNLSYSLSFNAATLLNPRNLRLVDPSSVTLVLPCYSTYSLIRPISILVTKHQVAVVCPSSAASSALALIRSALPHTNITAHTSDKPEDLFSLLQVACEVPTPWVVLGQNFDQFATFLVTLLHPYDIPVALGVRGHPLQGLSHHGFLRPALLAGPPFAVKRNILCQALQGLPNNGDLSLALGIRLLGLSALGYGAQLLPNGEHVKPTPGYWTRQVHNMMRRISRGEIEGITYLIILPDLISLLAFQRTVCRMAVYGHIIHLLLYDLKHFPSRSNWLMTGTCRLRYSTSDSLTSVLQWSQPLSPNVVIALSPSNRTSSLLQVLLRYTHPMAQILTLSPSDLPNAEWLATLTLQEWKRRSCFPLYLGLYYFHRPHITDWHIPLIRLVVITNNRPTSLTRLLRSLRSAAYFGDANVHLTINMEQTADPITRAIVNDLHSQWMHGTLSVRHRVVLGGLIPAIVESWYPASGDEYAVVLEDDVEVSPMFYAWAKMAVLRYRYGRGKGSALAGRVFGISLYQPRNVELRPQGRRPWNPRDVFRQGNVSDPTQVYLNQVPCSWGAVYFPEIWREFHDFLVLRLSAPFYPSLLTTTPPSNLNNPRLQNSNSQGNARERLSLNEHIVPDVRSNRWARSWKRFFIELVFLRGYLMVYPNYDGFLSFSTNHLERGSNVSDTSAQKKAMFVVPLMGAQEGHGEGIVDGLPWGELPALEDMPVVDLMGYIVDAEELAKMGEKRRRALTGRRRVPGSFDAKELFD